MTIDRTDEPAARRPLRLWPGVALVAAQLLVFFILPVVVPGAGMTALLAAVALGLAVFIWWLLWSRAPWAERIGVVVLMVLAMMAVQRIVHPSIANAGMGMMMFIYAVPIMSAALVAAAAATRRLASGHRRAVLLAAVVLAAGSFALVRTGGVSGEGDADLHWRWTPTPEERLLAQAGGKPVPPVAAAVPPIEPTEAPAEVTPTAVPSAPSSAEAIHAPQQDPPGSSSTIPSPATAEAKTRADWPGFRGPARDGVVGGVRLATDWGTSPPVELWRRPIGPGWSSFAVRGNLVYTQEQRGEEEIVSCYDLATGKPVWMHADAARFWESNGGAGPRATPAISKGRVYTLGATGILNALDANTGAVAWTRNAATETGAQNPGWGFAGSPLVIDDTVIVATSGRLAAYDAATGQPRWLGPTGGAGYSSPHLATIHGVRQVLLLRGARTTSVAPSDGTLLWEHTGAPGVSIVQPALTAEGDVLIAPGDAMGGTGIRRMAIAHGPAGWTVAERWASRGLKPYFNDFVVHEGHAFGFDGSILSSIDLADGQRKWKGGRYGNGQLMLLPDQDLLLVLSEEGELALVGAVPGQHTELARFKAIEGKTWNHPVLVGDVLLVRNGEEMAAFRLPLVASQ